MIDYLQKFKETVAAYPERVAVLDKDGDRSTTYKKLDELSSRVAAFLKSKGFQKEDLIAIHLEKSMEYIAVELGVMKAGIAYVPLSESMGQERITHVLKDSGAKLVFDAWKPSLSALKLGRILTSTILPSSSIHPEAPERRREL